MHILKIHGIGGYDVIGGACYRIKFYKCIFCGELFMKTKSIPGRIKCKKKRT